MKVHFLTRASRERASSRIRAWQVVDAWNHPDVTCSQWKQLGDIERVEADVVVLQKMKPSFTGDKILERLKQRTGCRIIWDMSDPEWCTRGDVFFQRVAAHVDEFVMSTKGLQGALEDDHGIKSVVIEDRLPYTPHQKVHTPTEVPCLVWFGMFPNRDVSIVTALQTFYRLNANDVTYTIKIIDDQPNVELPDADKHIRSLVTYTEWRLDTFERELLEGDVALLPPFPGEWGKMKSWNKQLTAAWAGLPTSDGQNYTVLKQLLTDFEYRQARGRFARAWAEREGNVLQSVQQWKDLLGWDGSRTYPISNSTCLGGKYDTEMAQDDLSR